MRSSPARCPGSRTRSDASKEARIRGLLIGLAIAAGAWLVIIVLLVITGRRTAAKELATCLPHLLAMFRGLIRDPRVPRRTKFWLVFGALWIASPIDLVPEFVPVIGLLDDAVVAALVLRHVAKRAGRALLAEHWDGDPQTLERFFRIARI